MGDGFLLTVSLCFWRAVHRVVPEVNISSLGLQRGARRGIVGVIGRGVPRDLGERWGVAERGLGRQVGRGAG